MGAVTCKMDDGQCVTLRTNEILPVCPTGQVQTCHDMSGSHTTRMMGATNTCSMNGNAYMFLPSGQLFKVTNTGNQSFPKCVESELFMHNDKLASAVEMSPIELDAWIRKQNAQSQKPASITSFEPESRTDEHQTVSLQEQAPAQPTPQAQKHINHAGLVAFVLAATAVVAIASGYFLIRTRKSLTLSRRPTTPTRV